MASVEVLVTILKMENIYVSEEMSNIWGANAKVCFMHWSLVIFVVLPLVRIYSARLVNRFYSKSVHFQ